MLANTLDTLLHRQPMTSDVALAIAPEVATADKKKKHRSSGNSKRPPARPYKKIEMSVLDARIAKLTTRVQKSKRQHECAQNLLSKYTQEMYFREKECLLSEPAQEPSA